MKNTKPWYASKGILGSLTALGGAFLLILSMLGIIDAEQAEAGRAALPEMIGAVLTAVGGICAFWGRLKATKTIASMLLLLAVAPGLMGCVGDPVTPKEIAAIKKAERPVSAVLTAAGDSRVCASGVALWSALAEDKRTAARWAGLAEACDLLLATVGPVVPVTAKVYDSPVVAACHQMPSSISGAQAAAYAETRHLAGCRS